MQKLFEVLYVSTLAPGAAVTEVPAIITASRLRNQQLELTGLLVFDGQHFCHHLEGPRKVVMTRLERIREDRRHVDIELLHHGELAHRRFRRFITGYAVADADGLIHSIRALDGLPAMERLLALMPTLDLD